MAATGFEGYEKRLEVSFFTPSGFADPEGQGLRILSRSQINSVLDAAQCTIVDQLSNEAFDSYVLSESSLFVYPYSIVIKTCGTTKLLKSIPANFKFMKFVLVKRRKHLQAKAVIFSRIICFIVYCISTFSS